MPHEMISVTIHGSQIDVDRRIARIVVWLNEFPGIRTEWSCEGDSHQNPYVLFYCSDTGSLKSVLERLRVWMTPYDCMDLGRINVHAFGDGLRYRLDFPCVEMRDTFTGRLKRSW